MKISSIKVKGLYGESIDKTYSFDKLPAESANIYFDVSELPDVINYVFSDKNANIKFDGSAEIKFKVKSNEYILTKTRISGKENTVLKQMVGNRSQRLAKPYEALKQIFECEIPEQLSGCIIDKADFEQFEKAPSIFGFATIKNIKAGADAAVQSYEKIVGKVVEAQSNIKTLSKNSSLVTEEQVQAVSRLCADKENEYLTALNNIKKLEDVLLTLNGDSALKTELDNNDRKITELLKNQASVDLLKAKISDHHKVQKLMPQLQEILNFRKQLRAAKDKIDESRNGFEVLAEERKAIVMKLAEINEEIKTLLEKSSQLIIIRNEDGEAEENDYSGLNIAEEIKVLNLDKMELENTVEERRARIAELDQLINEAGKDIKAQDFPVTSISELLESVRLSVKVKELQAAIEKKDKDLAVLTEKLELKEQEIETYSGELEKLLALDKEFGPLRSQKEINNILQAKIDKNKYIIKSLDEKEEKIEEEIQDLVRRELEINNAIKSLRANLENKEFNRVRFIKKQALHLETTNKAGQTDENSGGQKTPMSSSFLDEEIESIKNDISFRTNTKLEIVSEKIGLEYVLKEVRRQKSIAEGEIISGKKEKDLFTQKLSPAIEASQNTLIDNYIDAFNKNKATEFVLTRQKAAVKAQTEAEMFQAEINRERQQKHELMIRLQELSDIGQPGGQDLSAQLLVENDEKAKNEFLEITEKLITAQNERTKESESLKEVENKLFVIKSRITQFNQYQKALERGEQLKTYTKEEAEKIKQENEAALDASLNEKGRLEKEIIVIDDRILTEKMEVEKLNRNFEQLKSESSAKKELAARLMENLSGENTGSIKNKSLSKTDLEKYTMCVDGFELTLSLLRKKSDNIRLSMSAEDKPLHEDIVFRRKLEAEKVKKQRLEREVEVLRKRMSEIMTAYLESNKQKLAIAKMSNELAVVASMAPVLKQVEVAKQMYVQNIKKYIRTAAKMFILLTSGRYSLDIKDDIIFSDNNAKKYIGFSEMELIDRYMAYISLKTALPVVANGRCDTVILKGAVKAEKAEIAERLGRTFSDKAFVTNVMKAAETPQTRAVE